MNETVSRRKALTRVAVGTAAAGVAWSAPRVNGLSLRPDYARAQTGPGDSPGVSFVRDIFLSDNPDCDVSTDISGSFDLGIFGTGFYDGNTSTICSSDFDASVSLSLPAGCSLVGISFDPPADSSSFIPSGFDYGFSSSSASATAHLTIVCT